MTGEASAAFRVAQVRDAGPFDVGLLAALQEAAFEGEADAQAWGAAALAELLAGPGVLGLIVEAADRPLGYLLARLAAGEAELLSLGLLPTARGLGLGQVLLDSLCTRLRALGVEELFLEVAVDNAAAQRLYRRRGFREAGRRRAYYDRGGTRVDAVVMRLATR